MSNLRQRIADYIDEWGTFTYITQFVIALALIMRGHRGAGLVVCVLGMLTCIPLTWNRGYRDGYADGVQATHDAYERAYTEERQ